MGTGAVMINKILRIRRIGWRIQPPRYWRKNKKPQGGDGFDDVLREELMSEAIKPVSGNYRDEVIACTKVASTGGTASGEKR